ncbi:MAG: hypothetical protein HZC25_12690 [Rhodospirillales bacterium]|nr:hypothetical protein [Rhodospirillales bacterium]
MTSPIDAVTSSLTAPASTPTKAKAGGFDAALDVAQRTAAKREAEAAALQAIRDKGFRAWAGDMQIKKIKEELRKKALAAMGLDEEGLKALGPALRQILEQKIQAEIAEQLEKTLTEQRRQAEQEAQRTGPSQPGTKSSDAAGGAVPIVGAANERPNEKKDPGKSCRVIPALAWPDLPIQAL